MKKNISGERIRQERLTRNMTQAELTAKMQVQGLVIEREAVSKIETGDRMVADYELAALARIFGVAMEELLEK